MTFEKEVSRYLVAVQKAARSKKKPMPDAERLLAMGCRLLIRAVQALDDQDRQITQHTGKIETLEQAERKRR